MTGPLSESPQDAGLLSDRAFLDVVLPVLNEEASVARAVASAHDPAVSTILVVDGGSEDATIAVAQDAGARVLRSSPGRALQMNAGGHATSAEVVVFLHADTVLPPDFGARIRAALRDPAVVGGRFDVSLSGSDSRLRMVEFFMNMRSRLTGIATGDQAIFVRRRVFEEMKGFLEIPLMEDVEFTSRLRKLGRVAALRDRVETSSRRWEQNGILRTIVLMWGLRLAFAVGVGPDRLAVLYARGRPGGGAGLSRKS